jgi:hypothetical protein
MPMAIRAIASVPRTASRSEAMVKDIGGNAIRKQQVPGETSPTYMYNLVHLALNCPIDGYFALFCCCSDDAVTVKCW